MHGQLSGCSLRVVKHSENNCCKEVAKMWNGLENRPANELSKILEKHPCITVALF